MRIDTTLPVSSPLRFRKNLFHFYKNDSSWSKFLDRKIKQNEAAMSSGNLDQYEYLTGEDLDYKPSTV